MRYVICWTVIVLMAMGVVTMLHQVGKPRYPVTTAEAVTVVTVQMLLIIGMVYLLRTF